MDAEEAYEEMIREEREMAEKRKQREKDRELTATPNKSERITENQDGPPTTPASIEKASTSKSPGSSQPAKPGVRSMIIFVYIFLMGHVYCILFL